MSEPSEPVEPRTRRLADAIARTEREQRSERSRPSLWVQVSRVGTLGWLLALPIIGGALLGHTLDRRLGTGLTFTLGFLSVGLAMAGYALWRQAKDLDQD